MKLILTVIMVLLMPTTFQGVEPKEPIIVTLKPVEEAVAVSFFIKVETAAPLIVRIRNRDHQALFQQSYNGSKNYRGVFNLENLRDGVYYFEVRQREHVFQTEINLQEKSERYVVLGK